MLRKEADLKQIQTLLQGTQTRLKYTQSELEMIKKKHLAALYRVITDLHTILWKLEPEPRISGIICI